MADSAVQFLLDNLKQLLLYNASLILDVKDNVELLYNDLSLFKAFLKDSVDKRAKNEVLKDLVRQIRAVVNEAEDAIDTFIIHASVHKARGPIEKAFHILDYPKKLRDVAKEIESIRVKVKDIYDHKKFGFEALQTQDNLGKSQKDKRPPIAEGDNVVGFRDEADTVIGRLKGGSKELEVISIIGLPGLGKTTLAKKIYSDSRIEYEFYTRAWVAVSQDYVKREVYLNILGSITQLTDTMYKMSDEKLAEELSGHLQKGKYLIVMDDVWTKEAWDDLKVAFPNNNRGSRILLTSRIRNVAEHANRNGPPHMLRFLTEDESFQLLKQTVFGKQTFPPELSKLGRQIAIKCEGLPLALVVIGGILVDKGEISSWWETVAASVNTYVARDTERIIALSYDHLPYHLKACFLYIGAFPEDYLIPAWKLIRLWVAEGFIQQLDEVSTEDKAEEYLEELVSRNLVMVGQRRSNGRIKTCHIHDMLRDFCKKEAAEENFFQEVRRFDQATIDTGSTAFNSYRRLCIHSRLYKYLSSNPSGPRVRSFLSFASEETVLTPDLVSAIPTAFRLLRILDVRTVNFTRFPTDLTQLIHLRYIALSSNFKIIPSSISGLWNLQTIIIETSSRTLEFKADVWKMIHLRHIHTNASTNLPGPPSKSKKSKEDPLVSANLQTLCTISPQSCTDDVLARSPHLKKLGIRGKLAALLEVKNGTTLFDNLGKLNHLEQLKLMNDVFPLPPSHGKLPALPQKYKFPPKIKKLTLCDTLLDWRNMSILALLDNLEVLKLKDNAFEGEWWEPVDGGFRSLRVLHIGRTDLVSWNASAHHFPRLRHVVLRQCNSLKAVPVGLADVSSLQSLELYWPTHSAADSGRKIEKQKKEAEKQQDTKVNGFKLIIYPPDI